MAQYIFATLGKAALKYQRRIDYILRYAVERLISAAQLHNEKGGRMPIDLGALRNSLLSELNGRGGAIGEASHIFVAGAMKGGDFATFRWTMEYAAAVNNGSQGRPGAHFVQWAADQWQKFVREGTAAAKVRYP